MKSRTGVSFPVPIEGLPGKAHAYTVGTARKERIEIEQRDAIEFRGNIRNIFGARIRVLSALDVVLSKPFDFFVEFDGFPRGN
jgi:hypothetical protein